jgi:hypothetical protein
MATPAPSAQAAATEGEAALTDGQEEQLRLLDEAAGLERQPAVTAELERQLHCPLLQQLAGTGLLGPRGQLPGQRS